MENNIRIILIRPCLAKLQFVKTLKELTGLGLKEAKDLVDNICTFPFKSVEFKIMDGYTLHDVENGLSKVVFDGDDELHRPPYELNGGTKMIREKKMLQLGIGSDEDYKDFITQIILCNFGNSKDLLNFVLDKLPRKELEDVIKQIEF